VDRRPIGEVGWIQRKKARPIARICMRYYGKITKEKRVRGLAGLINTRGGGRKEEVLLMERKGKKGALHRVPSYNIRLQ